MEDILSPQSRSTVDSFVSRFGGINNITSYTVADLMLSIFNIAVGLRNIKGKKLDIETLQNVIIFIYDKIVKDETNGFENSEEVHAIVKSLMFFYENGINKNSCCIWACSKKESPITKNDIQKPSEEENKSREHNN